MSSDVVSAMQAQLLRLLSLLGILLTCAGLLRGTLSPGPLPVSPPENNVIADGEDLVYEVSWAFVKLGTIRLKTHRDRTSEAYIHSYDGLPFVDLHSVHYTTLDSCFYSLASRSLEKKEDEWWGLEYRFDTARKRLYVEEVFKKDFASPPYRRDMRDTIQLSSMSFIDGLSIAYFPRAFLHTRQTLTVPTVLYGKLGETTFTFGGLPTTESIDALPYPVRVIEVPGTTTVQGIYGMTGNFTGWFSDDAAGVPIKGKLKVLIGSVTVELIQWNRKGWSPPH